METRQRIALVRIGNSRVACSTMGDGPPLVFPPPSFGHLHMEFEHPTTRSFYQALASKFTLIRYDRLGTGLSDRDRPAATLTLDFELDVLEAVLNELGVKQANLFGFSYGGVVAAGFAARRPESVSRLLLFAAFASGPQTLPAWWAPLLGVLRADWDLGSRLLAAAFFPDGETELSSWHAQLWRESVTGEMAASLLDLWRRVELYGALDRIQTPTLVVHRRHDPLVPPRDARVLASSIPGARPELLEGNWHQPWFGDAGAVLGLAGEFLGLPLPVPAGENRREEALLSLTAREREVLQLVAQGLNDTAIARQLVLSAHTVHRHVANIRTRLGQPSRGAAAVVAARTGLI